MSKRGRGEDNPNPDIGGFTLGRVTPEERLVAERGLCAVHEHPEWWTDGRVMADRPYWFRANGSPKRVLGGSIAKRICLLCPVREECKRAIEHIERDLPLSDGNFAGVWGGEGPMDRLNRRKAERRRGVVADGKARVA